ncbi:ead/Ea22-like family protein [Escherichia coli]|uniref:ead/Ea22-like family protein n=1 Tax=Escherichia coli TaxID=562 RepID=UPI001259B384|nr:ead/Ea22-like family protein [Escherichia coli]NJW65568.1 ead/Ea22-like family protein [Escherichia coli]TZA39289.1 ead/Ea22-like family protein [Escherichia coli]TZA61901.1 ead/Ea22-like family protein [Escherichia coli]
MTKINYQALREAAEPAIPAMERLLMLPVDDDLISEQELKDYGVDIDALNAFKFLAGPETVLALLDERERNQQYIKRRDQENEDIALTVGKLRVELEGKDKLIAELGKQCAEWERKALSNFEECAAMAERIEELEHANTRQDANINHQHEGMTQSVTRHIYHYNAVNGSDSMSGIAQLTFMIKSQSDLEELKSALSKVCGFHANAITSLSYLGCEEEANTKDANPNGGA